MTPRHVVPKAVFLATAIFSCSAAATERFPSIISGTDAEPGAWPWMVALVQAGVSNTHDGQFCGGSLINPRWVLTAAHCFLNEENTAVDTTSIPDVLVGTTELGLNQGQRISVQRVITHPDYAPSVSQNNDIALLELSEPVSSQLVNLPGQTFDAFFAVDGTEASAMGWGNTSTTHDVYPSSLKQVNLPLVSSAICQSVYPALTDQMICAGDGLGVRDTCQGDSGGPLVVPAGQEWVQVGVTSFGEGCATENSYGVYARVSRFANWISDSICTDKPDPVQIEVPVTGNTVTLSFTPVSNASGYRLYFAPPTGTSIAQADLGTATSLSVELPSGSSFYVAVQPYNGACLGPFSNISLFQIP